MRFISRLTPPVDCESRRLSSWIHHRIKMKPFYGNYCNHSKVLGSPDVKTLDAFAQITVRLQHPWPPELLLRRSSEKKINGEVNGRIARIAVRRAGQYLVEIDGYEVRPPVAGEAAAGVDHGEKRRRVVPAGGDQVGVVGEVVHQDERPARRVHGRRLGATRAPAPLHSAITVCRGS